MIDEAYLQGNKWKLRLDSEGAWYKSGLARSLCELCVVNLKYSPPFVRLFFRDEDGTMIDPRCTTQEQLKALDEMFLQ